MPPLAKRRANALWSKFVWLHATPPRLRPCQRLSTACISKFMCHSWESIWFLYTLKALKVSEGILFKLCQIFQCVGESIMLVLRLIIRLSPLFAFPPCLPVVQGGHTWRMRNAVHANYSYAALCARLNELFNKNRAVSSVGSASWRMRKRKTKTKGNTM